MQNFVNDTLTMVADSINGVCIAHQDKLFLNTDPLFVRRVKLSQHKVGLVSGGGSGHEPMHVGFVGQGMLDASCPGQVLTSPTPDQIVAAITVADRGKGVLLLVKNYQGDRMNFELAKSAVDCPVEVVLINDDATFDDRTQARGLAGTLVVEKLVGAAAERGQSLTQLKALADQVNLGTHTIGVALGSLSYPMSGTMLYDIPKGKMEYGVGIHGEKGKECCDALGASALVDRLIDDILVNYAEGSSKRVLLFVNGLGGIPMLVLYIMYGEAVKKLESLGFTVVRSLVGSYVTSLTVNGCSITVSALDDELVSLWDDPVKTANLNW